uniref:Uncharacterized protein n=1 Tax=Cacopsylla melanoneura TaxID=428564 RepID=A0A8D9EYU1_9HEMI
MLDLSTCIKASETVSVGSVKVEEVIVSVKEESVPDKGAIGLFRGAVGSKVEGGSTALGESDFSSVATRETCDEETHNWDVKKSPSATMISGWDKGEGETVGETTGPDSELNET